MFGEDYGKSEDLGPSSVQRRSGQEEASGVQLVDLEGDRRDRKPTPDKYRNIISDHSSGHKEEEKVPVDSSRKGSLGLAGAEGPGTATGVREVDLSEVVINIPDPGKADGSALDTTGPLQVPGHDHSNVS